METQFPVALQLSWIQDLLIFKIRCYGGLSFGADLQGQGCLIWGLNSLFLRVCLHDCDVPPTCGSQPQRGLISSLCLFLLYFSQCGLLFMPLVVEYMLCQSQVIFRVSFMTSSCFFLYLWKEVSSGFSYSAIFFFLQEISF